MPIRQDLSINWAVSPRIIEVAASSIELTVQDLYDTLRSLGVEAIDEPEIIDGSGKEVLSATELVGLTVKLLNAKVKFEDRTSPTDCDISGGNLVALDMNGDPMNPIQYAENVTVTYAKSTSATLVQAPLIEEIPSQIWEHNDRRLTSRDIDSELPGEHISSEKQVLDIGMILDAIKGLGFKSDEDALTIIRQLLESVPPSTPRAHVSI